MFLFVNLIMLGKFFVSNIDYFVLMVIEIFEANFIWKKIYVNTGSHVLFWKKFSKQMNEKKIIFKINVMTCVFIKFNVCDSCPAKSVIDST